MLGAMAVVLGMTVPILTVAAGGAQVASALGDCGAPTALGALCVESSSASGGANMAPYDNPVVTKGQKIPDFKWLVNEDNSTGDPSFTADNVAKCLPARAAVDAVTAAANPALAIYQHAGSQPLTDCPWPSVHASAGHSTVIASGDQSDVGSLAGLQDGKYLISVTATGFKIDGIHFEVSGGSLVSVNEEPGAPFVVRMNPLPKKTNTVRVHVYNDNASTNGQWDGQTETLITCADATPQQVAANCGGSTDPNLVGDPSTDMSGFSVQITDVLAQTTTDVYGSPLCTQYETDANGNILLNDDGTPNPISFGGVLAGTDSTCISDHYGDIVIPNMGPNRYAATVIPPDPRTHDGDKWVQTTTLEGGHDWDTWNIEGGTGYDTELIVGGERVTPVAHGFVKLTHNDQVWNDAEKAGKDSTAEKSYYSAAAGFSDPGSGNKRGELTGTLAIGRAYVGSGGAAPLAGTNLTNAKKDGVIEDGLVSVSCLAGCNAAEDSTVWTGRARKDGTFDINGLETGDYSVALWDEAQSYIMAVLQYSVTSYPAVTSASRITTGANQGQLTLNFGSNSGLTTGTTITLIGSSNPTWNGTFVVTFVSGNGRTVRVQKQSVPPTSGTAGTAPRFTTDMSDVLLPGWFTDLQGSIFNDLNGDGIRNTCATQCDPKYVKNAEGVFTEPGIPDFVLTERTRGNSLQDQGAAVAATNDEGDFDLSQSYPLGQFLILEAYNQRYKNTGYTYTTDNDKTPHTVLTQQVDINFLPVIGLSAHVDWGVQAYGTGTDYWSGGVQPLRKDENGGIVGTVTYDTTRNEFDPAYSVQEDYQAGISGIPMQLWKTHKTNGVIDKYPDTGAVQQWGLSHAGHLGPLGDTQCLRPDASRGLNAVTDASQDCKPYDYYVTESWQRPVGCAALDVNGNPLTGELALPAAPALSDVDYSHNPDNLTSTSTFAQRQDCIEAPMSGFQIGGNGTVDGNYALTSLMSPATLAAAPAGGADLEAIYADTQNNPGSPCASNPAKTCASAPLASGDYIVEAVNPEDTINSQQTHDPTMGGYLAPKTPADPAGGTTAKRLYHFTDETAVNVMSGDPYVPQDGFAATTDPGGGSYKLKTPTSKVRADVNPLGAGTVAKCAGGTHVIPLNNAAGLGAMNPDFNDAGGSPYAGQTVPLCDAKVVSVVGGRSMNPGFNMYADVPIPTKFYGLVNDDLNVNVDRRSILLGEVAPASNVPVGVYDENGNWKLTAHSDVNGFYEILLPSTDTYNCPLPAGPCPNMYRLVGNDPGTLAHRNDDYNPQFRTIATEFQAWPGVVHPVDQAPTHQGITIEGPASQFGALSLCKLAVTNPTLFRIDKPYYDPGDVSTRTHVVQGMGFGTNATTTLTSASGVAVTVPSTSTENSITFTVPTNLAPGPYQLGIKANGLQTVNGLTFHVLAGSGNNTYLHRTDVYEVTPDIATDQGRQFTPVHDAWDPATNTPAGFFSTQVGSQWFNTDVNGVPVGNANNTAANSPNGRAIQRAVQAAYNAGNNGNNPKLVVIYPNTASNYAPHNPNAAYFENVVLHGKVKLQGVGPGGATSPTNIVYGTTIDASQFWSATQVVPPGGNQDTADGTYSDDWRTFAGGITRSGNGPTELPEGEGILAIAQAADPTQTPPQPGNTVTSALSGLFTPGVDGMLLTGGDQQGNPGNINTLPGAAGGIESTTPPPVPVGPAQGGAIMTDQFVQNFNITNNQIQSNGGTYGTIRIGTPDLPADSGNNHNDGLVVANNRIVANGGTNLAGALGIFAGTPGYKVKGNDFCGDFSAEYGGAISHYGLSAGGSISMNRIYYNQSYDEGGGIMIAGALPANPGFLSPGAGAVTIDSNYIEANLSNDDGGGIRFLSAGNFPETVTNNIIANNVSTHEGGGVALDDAPNVRFVNNTVVKNITTATAATSDHNPAPAGLSTGRNSSLLQQSMPGTPLYSNPVMFNNIFADNRAGNAVVSSTNANLNSIQGIGAPGDSSPIRLWDMGSSDPSITLSPTNSILSDVGGPNQIRVTQGINPSGTNQVLPISAIKFVRPIDFLVDSLTWRVNANTSFPVLVAQMVPVTNLMDYHIYAGSPAINKGAASAIGIPSYQRPPTNLSAPSVDIDNDQRTAPIDIGADEITGRADLSITKTDGQAKVNPGSPISYTITVSNAGSDAVIGARVTDNPPTVITGVAWTCAGTCGAASGTGSINTTVDLAAGASAVFTLTGTVAADATGSVSNTANVAAPVGTVDPNLANNSATDVDSLRSADLGITKTDGQTTVTPGAAVHYTIVVSSAAGSDAVTGATVTDTAPAALAGVTWTCSGTGCGAVGGTGSINTTVNLTAGGSVTYTLNGTLVTSASGSLVNTAAVAVPAGTADPDTTNNSATDTDQIILPLPTPGLLDNFNRGSANTLNNGTNWSQVVLLGSAAIRVNTNQASDVLVAGAAYWNSPPAGFGSKQGAAFTIANTTVNGDSLVLKVTGSSATLPTNFIRVRYNSGQVTVDTTINGGLTFAPPIGTFSATLANGNTFTAVANADGSVDVWQNTTYLGRTSTSTFTGTGRIGMQLPAGARVDDFRGGTL